MTSRKLKLDRSNVLIPDVVMSSTMFQQEPGRMEETASYRIIVDAGKKDTGIDTDGTDTNVFIQLFGDIVSAEICLPHEGFKDREEFQIEVEDLGNLRELRIWHDNSGTNPDVYLRSVKVIEERTGSRYTFLCHRWLADNKGDGKTMRQLRRMTQTNYKVTVKCREIRGGNRTNSTVFIQLFGDNGTSEELEFSHGLEKLKRRLYRLKYLGEITNIRIWHNNKGSDAGFYLDYIKIEDETTGQVFQFMCNQWLAADKEDGQTERKFETERDIKSSTAPPHSQVRRSLPKQSAQQMPLSKQPVFNDANKKNTTISNPVANSKTSAPKASNDEIPTVRIPSTLFSKSPIVKAQSSPKSYKSPNDISENKPSQPNNLSTKPEMETPSQMKKSLPKPKSIDKSGDEISENKSNQPNNLSTKSRIQKESDLLSLESSSVYLPDKTQPNTPDSKTVAQENESLISFEETIRPVGTMPLESCNISSAMSIDHVDSKSLQEKEKTSPSDTSSYSDNSLEMEIVPTVVTPVKAGNILPLMFSDNLQNETANEQIQINDRSSMKFRDDLLMSPEEDLYSLDSAASFDPFSESDQSDYSSSTIKTDNDMSMTHEEQITPLDIRSLKSFDFDISKMAPIDDSTPFDSSSEPVESSYKSSMTFGPCIATLSKQDPVHESDDEASLKYVNAPHPASEIAPPVPISLVAVDVEPTFTPPLSNKEEHAVSYDRISRTPTSVIVKGIRVYNIPDMETVSFIYSCNGHEDIIYTRDQGSLVTDSNIEHELSGYGQLWSGGMITMTVADGIEYIMATCQIPVEGQGPMISINKHARTSESTATVKKVDLLNFPSDDQLHVHYYDGEDYLGTFFAAEPVHKLTDLKKSSEQIKVIATDDFGNIAETVFIVNQNIPIITYEKIYRTANSIVVKGVKLENFPDNADAAIIYSSDGPLDLQVSSAISEHYIPGLEDNWEGLVVAKAIDVTNEYTAECVIPVAGKMETYKIQVSTADVTMAGTDANVYIEIFGEDGETGRQFLTKSKTHKRKFQRGKTDEFDLETFQLGNIEKIRIGHDSKGFFSSWMLDKVEIEAASLENRLLFLCGHWLDKKQGDGLTERELFPLEKGNMETYNIYVRTADEKGASGAEGNVYIDIYGENGNTGKQYLNQSRTNKETFKRGNTDHFIIETTHLGQITKINVGIESKNKSIRWMLESIEIEESAGDNRLYFPCGRFIENNEDNETKEQELLPVEKELLQTYNIYVTTGEEKGAGTDGNIYLDIFGENGNTGHRFLTKSKTHKEKFKRGNTDHFTLEAAALGSITKINVGHVKNGSKGESTRWMLDKIEIEDPTCDKTIYFPCRRWFDKNDDDDKSEQELLPADKEMYTVHVFTADKIGAGTDANVYVIIYGENGDTGKQFLTKSKTNKNPFERGKGDEFTLESPLLGNIEKITIGHDNKGGFAGWMLDRVEIEAPSIENQLCFECRRWFDKNEDDGLIERELYPKDELEGVSIVVPTVAVDSADAGEPVYVNQREDEKDDDKRHVAEDVELETYNIHVFTADKKGAGTDGNIHIDIYGENGNTGQTYLNASTTNKEKFKRGNTDHFEIESARIGKITHIKIGVDNNADFNGWTLNKVEIGDSSTDKLLYFPCGRRLEKIKDNDNELIEMELKPVEKEFYSITVITANKRGAGTDANVFIIIYGDKRETGKRLLKHSQTNENKFERGKTDEFTLEAPQLGNIQKIRIGHDNKGGFAGWMLDRVIIEAPSMEKRLYFPCDQWLDKNEDDGLIERELLPVLKETYHINVTTSTKLGAGTDASVYIIIFGDDGETDQHFLKSSKTHKKKFKCAQTDVFDLETVNVGDVKKIKIGHDNKGACPGWLLDRVDIGACSLKKRYTFLCGLWFDKNGEDGLIERELYPE